MKIALLAFVLVLSNACGKFRFFRKSSEVKQSPITTGTLQVNVYYEEGAEPYTSISGAQLNLPVSQLQVFNVLQANLKAMFPGKNVIVPKDLLSMVKIGAQNQTTWTFGEINTLGDSLGQTSAGDTTVFNVFFVKGHAENPRVIGVHLSGTKTMAIFKDVVVSSGNSEFVKTYVEQATVVHELGHAVGLVNNGLPLTSSHEDPTHKAHCQNPNCVMYWQNEGATDLASFIASRSQTPDLVMLDQACLKDVTSYKN